MKKTITACCALCQISSVNNSTTVKSLKSKMNTLKQEMLDNKEVGTSTGNGQTTVFIIVSPGEHILEYNLIKLGFRNRHNFGRRIGYPKTGDLQMYIKNL